MTDMIKNFVGSRKAIMVAILIVAATAFVFAGKMDLSEWRDFVTWISGIWIGAQGIEDAVVKSARVKAGAK